MCALAAGVLSSAVPFLADLLALRRVPAYFFGIFMSVNPVFAALIGMVVLGQHLGPASWLAVAVIVTANAVAVGTATDRSRGRSAGPAKAATGVVAASSGRTKTRCAGDTRSDTVGAHDTATPHTTAVHRR